jgi:hypothetical protein
MPTSAHFSRSRTPASLVLGEIVSLTDAVERWAESPVVTVNKKCTMIVTTPVDPTYWIDAEPEAFSSQFEKYGFSFAHRLAGHPLFAIEKLIVLAKSLSEVPGQVVYDAGDVRVDQRWDEVPLCDVPAHVLMERIDTAGAWILLKHADKEPGYGDILDQCISDVQQLSGWNLDGMIKAKKSIVFLNSPHRVTSYHIDHQSTFLLQLRGRKTISIFDREDREVLSESELENFWGRDQNAARYKPHLQHRARTIELEPGTGVHIPVNAPHWVQNGPEVSVSLNFNFDFDERLRGDVYRANYWMRKFGLKPAPPKSSALEDGLKGALIASTRTLRDAFRSFRNLSESLRRII